MAFKEGDRVWGAGIVEAWAREERKEAIIGVLAILGFGAFIIGIALLLK